MNKYYNELMNLKAADDFKGIIMRWQVLSENIKSRPTDAPIILPDMLWVAKSGVGRTTNLRLMSEYLYATGNLMEFYGDVKYFEFLLSYCSPDAPFTELERLIDEVNNAAGFRSEFKGVIHIDINDWIEHYEEKHFVSFMEYLSSNSDNWLIVLSMYSENEQAIHNMNAFLSMYLRIEKIVISLPKTEDLSDYIEEKFSAYGLALAPDAKEILYNTVEKLRNNKYFDGFKTIKMLCQDIVYSVFSGGKIEEYLITADMLKDFSEDSEYVKRTVANIHRVNKIGLVNTGK